jgi:hypothetical protein
MNKRLRIYLACFAVLAFLGASAYGQDGDQEKTATLRNAADAIGLLRFFPPIEQTDVLNRVRFEASGTMSMPSADGTWQDYQVDKYLIDLSYQLPAARVDIERSANGNSERHIAVVYKNLAWDEETPGGKATPTPEAVDHRLRQIWTTPQGFIMAANWYPDQVTITRDGVLTVLSMPINGRSARAFLDENMRPQRIEMDVQHPQFGESVWAASYDEYKDFDFYGNLFPARIVQTLNGHKVLDLTISELYTGLYAAFPVPGNIRQDSSH